MENLPFVLIALACPVGMLLMMLVMGRGMPGMGHGHHQNDSPPADPEHELSALLAERARIDARIAATREFEGDGREQPAAEAADIATAAPTP